MTELECADFDDTHVDVTIKRVWINDKVVESRWFIFFFLLYFNLNIYYIYFCIHVGFIQFVKIKKNCIKVLKYYKYEFLNNYWNVI